MTKVDYDYATARKRAFWQKISRTLTGSCNDLLSFRRVLQHLHEQPFTELGIQDIPLDKVIGSHGREYDYDLSFAPLREERDKRWVNVAQAYQNGLQLPPIRVYKIAEVYFVVDGNHRVSVARYYGDTLISASVVEIDPSPLIPKQSCTRMGYKV